MTSLPDGLDGYDAVFLDLDGTVIRGAHAVSGAAEVIAGLRGTGMALRFITNNASRSPAEVASNLTRLGIPATADDVLTSGQAAVAVVSSILPAGAPVLVLGTEALVAEVRSAGLRPVTSATEEPAGVLQGHSPDTGWAHLAEASLAIRNGAVWIACNVDRTLPTERGLLPGNGAMVAAVRAATDREPRVVGKPGRALLDTAIEHTAARRALVVGDRLDTDIAGASAAGLDSLLVLSGVSDAAGLVAAPPQHRPVYVASDLRALCAGLNSARIVAHPGWRAEVDGAALVLHSNGVVGDPLDALRTLCAMRWERDGEPIRLLAGDGGAAAALEAVGFTPPVETAQETGTV